MRNINRREAMRSSRIALATAFTLAFFAPEAVAGEVVETSAELAAGAVAPAGSDASTAIPAGEASAAPEGQPAADSQKLDLGPVGLDEQGRSGRIHVITPGDTLWDISDAYLGTPWVWPSVWRENGDIQNPHQIFPGDRIWITATEMRKVTGEEAEQLLSSALSDDAAVPAAMEEGFAAFGEDEGPRPTYHYSAVEAHHLVTVEDLKGMATIIDSHVPRVWLSESVTVIIGRGAGEVEVGDQFEIIRPGELVRHPMTGDPFGYSTKQLGWLEVEAVHPETATGMIRISRAGIRRGDHVIPREYREKDIEIGPTPAVDGRILFTPDDRLNMGSDDVVFLDRGASHGLDVGSPLEVYRDIGTGLDTVRGEQMELPDSIVAKLLVVHAESETAVALVTHSTVELTRGDRFRGSDSVR